MAVVVQLMEQTVVTHLIPDKLRQLAAALVVLMPQLPQVTAALAVAVGGIKLGQVALQLLVKVMLAVLTANYQTKMAQVVAEQVLLELLVLVLQTPLPPLVELV